VNETAKTPLSILIAGLSWPPESFLTRLIRGLAESGIQVTLPIARKPDANWRSVKGIQWISAPSWDGSVLHRVSHLARMGVNASLRSAEDIALFSRHISQNNNWARRQNNWFRLLPFAGKRWDVIYFPWNYAAITYFPLFDFGCPVVVSCRGSQINVVPHNPRRPNKKNGLRETFHKASAVHCVSEAIKTESLQYGLDPTKAWVIRPAVPQKDFVPADNRNRTTNEFVIVTTGSLIWRKGYEYALVAIRRLLDRGVPARFEIIGDGPERQRLLFTIADLKLEQHVHLHGKLPPDRVRDVLQGADLFLFSSLSEGVPNAVLEAMSTALPVVTFDCDGIREAVTDGVEGFVVPLRDPEAITNSVELLYRSESLRDQMGRAGRARVLKEFSLDQQIQKFEILFREVSRTNLRIS
jgi:colanic acid/amylovoran/stewartan biosynthesis glycosyltransferase WcaL/AmsK/CpsK